METTASNKAPIACTLEAGELKERLVCIAELNRVALLSTRREGSRLILPEEAVDALDVIFEPFVSETHRNGSCACSAASGRNGETNKGC